MKNLKGAILRLAISLGAVGFIIYSFRSKLGEAVGILRTEVLWEYFIVALGTYVVGLLIISYRLQIMLKVHAIVIRFWESFYLVLVGLFFNSFLPSAVGGDIVKIYYAAKHAPDKKMQAATSVIMDRLMGFVALAILTLGAFAFYSRQSHDTQIDKIIYLFLGGIFLLVTFFVSRRANTWIRGVARFFPKALQEKVDFLFLALYEFKLHVKSMSAAVVISMIGQVFFILIYYWLCLSLHVELPISTFFILVPILTVLSMAPSLGGLGVREAGVIYLFSNHMAHERALALSLLLDILIYGYSVLSGVVYSIRGGAKKSDLEKMEKTL